MDSATPARRSPRNPWLGFVYAKVALVGAAAGVVLLALDWSRIVASELSGQRTEGLVFTLPVILAAVGVVALVRAFRALGPWRRYRAETSDEVARHDRRADAARPRGANVALIVLGSLCVAGLVALAFVRPPTLAGVAVAIEVAAVLVLGALVSLRAGVSGVSASR